MSLEKSGLVASLLIEHACTLPRALATWNKYFKFIFEKWLNRRFYHFLKLVNSFWFLVQWISDSAYQLRPSRLEYSQVYHPPSALCSVLAPQLWPAYLSIIKISGSSMISAVPRKTRENIISRNFIDDKLWGNFQPSNPYLLELFEWVGLSEVHHCSVLHKFHADLSVDFSLKIISS